MATANPLAFGTVETNDLSELLDALKHDGKLIPPVATVGKSYGAALALRWKTVEPRLNSVVAIAPYAVLSNAVLNICRKYSPWFPQALLKAGLKKLPGVLKVKSSGLNTTTVLARNPITALFIAGADDEIMPVADVRKLYEEAAPGSKFILVPGAIHEIVPYYFDEIIPPVLRWLNHGSTGQDALRPIKTPGSSRGLD